MKSEELRALQAPLKEKYKSNPNAAMITLKAEGKIGEGLSCKIETGKALVSAGVHPATGGTGMMACSGDMLLEALVACAGVTLSAIATALGIELRTASLRQKVTSIFAAHWGFKGSARWIPGHPAKHRFENGCKSGAAGKPEKLTERYCVVYQTLIKGTPVNVSYHYQS
jgi:uncharacterized OsmC-like protein